MKMEDMILVSTDDHIVEPPDMFERRTPAKFKGQFPKMVKLKSGADAWLIGDRLVPNVAVNAVVGRRREEYGMEPEALDQLREATYNVHKRIDDMNVIGLLSALNFGSWPGFGGENFGDIPDRTLGLAVLQAYNDWHIDEWCGSYPGRFIPLGMIPLWDSTLAAEEMRRLKKKGCNAVQIPPNPGNLGYPNIHQDYWKPVWQTANDEGIVICIHFGNSAAAGAAPSADMAVEGFITNMPVTLYSIASDILFSRILRDYPDIKFALSEGGIGWIPHFLERADYVFDHHNAWTKQDFGGRKPSDVFKEHVITCFIHDPTGIKNRHDIGIDMITWECDYPHADCTWPDTPEILWESLNGVPDEEIHKITWQNACRAFDFDPFKHARREDCTVGALRAKAAHVDVSPMKLGVGGRAPERNAQGVITVAALQKQLSGLTTQDIVDEARA